jgi:hypothetical protein
MFVSLVIIHTKQTERQEHDLLHRPWLGEDKKRWCVGCAPAGAYSKKNDSRKKCEDCSVKVRFTSHSALAFAVS